MYDEILFLEFNKFSFSKFLIHNDFSFPDPSKLGFPAICFHWFWLLEDIVTLMTDSHFNHN